jgi:hypothetical protein
VEGCDQSSGGKGRAPSAPNFQLLARHAHRAGRKPRCFVAISSPVAMMRWHADVRGNHDPAEWRDFMGSSTCQ